MTSTLPTDPTQPAIVCPTWCVRWDHHADDVDEQHPPRHYGPDFGVLSVEAVGADKPTAVIYEPIHDVSATDLRQLAADAQSAAEWLEAHQS